MAPNLLVLVLEGEFITRTVQVISFCSSPQQISSQQARIFWIIFLVHVLVGGCTTLNETSGGEGFHFTDARPLDGASYSLEDIPGNERTDEGIANIDVSIDSVPPCDGELGCFGDP